MKKNIKTELNLYDEINNSFKRIRMSRQEYHSYNPDFFFSRAFTDTFTQYYNKWEYTKGLQMHIKVRLIKRIIIRRE